MFWKQHEGGECILGFHECFSEAGAVSTGLSVTNSQDCSCLTVQDKCFLPLMYTEWTHGSVFLMFVFLPQSLLCILCWSLLLRSSSSDVRWQHFLALPLSPVIFVPSYSSVHSTLSNILAGAQWVWNTEVNYNSFILLPPPEISLKDLLLPWVVSLFPEFFRRLLLSQVEGFVCFMLCCLPCPCSVLLCSSTTLLPSDWIFQMCPSEVSVDLSSQDKLIVIPCYFIKGI